MSDQIYVSTKYQFPMGKVKSTSVNQVILSGGMYQFPMGKVEVVPKSEAIGQQHPCNSAPGRRAAGEV